MSDQTDLLPDQSTALVVIPASAISTIVGADKDDILGKLAAKVATFKPDASTSKGRDAIRSLAAEVASSKRDLIRLGKSLTEGWRKSTAAVNAECRVIEERMDALKVQVRARLTAWEERETKRVQAHEDALVLLDRWSYLPDDATAALIEVHRLEFERSVLVQRPWEEFVDRASDTVANVRDTLSARHGAAVRREKEAAEQAEEAERARVQAEQDRIARETRIAAEAAEAARLAAEAEASRQAAAAAAEAERVRLAAIADGERRVREAEERATAEARQVQVDRQAEEDRAAADLAEQQAMAETQRLRAEAAEQQAAAARAETERRADVAIKAERRRVADEQERIRQETAAREADKRHRGAVNTTAMAALVEHAGLKDAQARAVVVAIAQGKIPAVKIVY